MYEKAKQCFFNSITLSSVSYIIGKVHTFVRWIYSGRWEGEQTSEILEIDGIVV